MTQNEVKQRKAKQMHIYSQMCLYYTENSFLCQYVFGFIYYKSHIDYLYVTCKKVYIVDIGAPS